MKIVLGMSGGVDSCVAAKILKEQGFEVVGCCLLLTPDASSDSEAALRARQAADRMGIDLVVADCREEFRKTVMQPFAEAYFAGRTPNPCVDCNPGVKIRSLCRVADELGIEAVATGHYARIDRKTNSLLCAPTKKDQTYFLYRLTPEQLSRLHFPLGEFSEKADVRALAQNAGFDAANAKDSQEICFLPDGDYTSFLLSSFPDMPSKEGNFLDIHGNIIGRHKGIIHYTAGQRKGLGAFGKPMYVKRICPQDNTVILCTAEERFADTLTATDLSWCSGEAPADSFEALVKIRSTARPAPAKITLHDGRADVAFETAQLSPSPGQSAVFYDGDRVLGGGFIE
ncbi:MAG: tRNA 2-thiouridine(34) synthase MnmA [Clostridia bacterium]|nr:tRNA 2-thiouridine(34) synthase MnmA [Clostridia bacterium]